MKISLPAIRYVCVRRNWIISFAAAKMKLNKAIVVLNRKEKNCRYYWQTVVWCRAVLYCFILWLHATVMTGLHRKLALLIRNVPAHLNATNAEIAKYSLLTNACVILPLFVFKNIQTIYRTISLFIIHLHHYAMRFITMSFTFTAVLFSSACISNKQIRWKLLCFVSVWYLGKFLTLKVNLSIKKINVFASSRLAFH